MAVYYAFHPIIHRIYFQEVEIKRNIFFSAYNFASLFWYIFQIHHRKMEQLPIMWNLFCRL